MANNKLTDSLRNSVAAESLDKGINNKNLQSGQTNDSTTAPVSNIAGVKPATAKQVKKTPTKKAAVKSTTTPLAQQAKPSNKPAAASNTAKSTTKLPESFAASLTHKKLHNIVETNYHLCETYLENLQKASNSLHDYFNQLVEINNLNALIKLNLSYLSSAPTRFQEMIAQNKNIFSDFFKFANLKEK